MRTRLALPALLLLAAATLAAGCGRDTETTPVACLEGPGPYLKALAAAPGPVTLDDQVAISECLVENQAAGELARAGEAMVAAATRLNGEARANPGGEESLQLGYLVGAAQRGAAGNEGIDTELIRRLVVAASYSPDNRPLPAAFKRSYREGFDAGHDQG
jgi:hypothetical protein